MAEPATGVKISELVEASYILPAAKLEIVQEGDNFKVPYSLLIQGQSAIDYPRLNAIGEYQASFTLTTLNVPELLAYTVERFDTFQNNLFEQVSNGVYKYLGDDPAALWFNTKLKGRPNSNRDLYLSLYRNNLEFLEGPQSLTAVAAWSMHTLKTFIILQKNDIISAYIEQTIAPIAPFIETNYQNSAEFLGYVNESDIVGPELFENPDLLSLDGITGVAGVALSLIEGGGVLATRDTGAGAFSQPIITITGCTTSARHRLQFSLKRGAQGTAQDFYIQNAFTVVSTAVNAGDATIYVFDFIAITATVQIVPGTGPTDGDEIEILAPITCKEYL
jgi:hypothetical protein